METEDEDAFVTLGISVPVDPSKELLDVFSGAPLEVSDRLIDSPHFSNLPSSLDPNLGIVGSLPSSNIWHEKSMFNPWNIEPHFLHVLPLSTSSESESSILIFGGLNPSSVATKNPPDFGFDDLVLGSTIFQYLLDSGIWKYYGTMFEPICYHACAKDGQFVYITGGYSLLKREHGEMLSIASTNRLDLNDKCWKSCSDMTVSRAAHALVSHKGRLYAFGGRNSEGNILASVEMYFPDEDIWIEITSLPDPAMGLSATCILDTIWLVGGITDHSSQNPANCLLSSVTSFIPSKNKWHSEEPLPYACAFSSCISNDYAIWIVGGCTVSENSEDDMMVSSSVVLQLSLSEKPLKWKSLASLLCPRHALTAITYGNSIYVVGGIESNNKSASDKVEIINFIGNNSALHTNLPVPITGCSSMFILQDTSKDYVDPKKKKEEFPNLLEREDYMYDLEKDYYDEGNKTSSMLDQLHTVDKNKYMPIVFDSSLSEAESSKETINRAEEMKKSPFDKQISIPKLPLSGEKNDICMSKKPQNDMDIESSSKNDQIIIQHLPASDEKLQESFDSTESESTTKIESYSPQDDTSYQKLSALDEKSEKDFHSTEQKSDEDIQNSFLLKETSIQKLPSSDEKLHESFHSIESESTTEIEKYSPHDNTSIEKLPALNEKSPADFQTIEQKSGEEIKNSSLPKETSIQKLPASDEKHHDSFHSEEPESIGNSFSQEQTSVQELPLSDEKLHKDLPSIETKLSSVCDLEKTIKVDSFGEKDISNQNSEAKIQGFESSKNPRCRASMEMIPHSDTVPLNILRKQKSATKWLDYFKKHSASDEKLHKKVFQSTESKLSLKTEFKDTKSEKSHKSAEVKYFEDKNLVSEFERKDFVASTRVQGSSDSEHRSFSYVISSDKSQRTNTGSQTKDNNASLETHDFDLDELPPDQFNRTEIKIDEASFPLILLMGGEYSRKAHKSRFILSYGCDENTWEYAGYMPEYRCHHCSVFLNNKIYIIGGFDSENSKLCENITSKTIYYDINSKIWHRAADLHYARSFHTAVVFKNEIYVLGGRNPLGNILSSVEVYSDSNGQWKECTDLPYPVLGAASAAIQGLLYVFGGITFEDDDEVISSKTANFNPINNRWRIGTDMAIPLAFCGISNFLDSAWLIGGCQFKEDSIISSKDVLKFDIVTKAWSKVAEILVPRFASVTLSMGNKAYIIGGHNALEKREVLTCELIDFSKNEVSLLSNLPVAISGKAGALISNGETKRE